MHNVIVHNIGADMRTLISAQGLIWHERADMGAYMRTLISARGLIWGLIWHERADMGADMA